ncbi:hypothetical protein NUW54_g13988 [Trametes sanguinea]|uniref:Uncharacterized protein n=1 Tax=Trametes sanguinea TaxID=158606 RepID=A0ACC1MHV1_9APHY|nr:hypothetical protein NUW54_g13988 [Trametes sanguinea]
MPAYLAWPELILDPRRAVEFCRRCLIRTVLGIRVLTCFQLELYVQRTTIGRALDRPRRADAPLRNWLAHAITIVEQVQIQTLAQLVRYRCLGHEQNLPQTSSSSTSSQRDVPRHADVDGKWSDRASLRERSASSFVLTCASARTRRPHQPEAQDKQGRDIAQTYRPRGDPL